MEAYKVGLRPYWWKLKDSDWARFDYLRCVIFYNQASDAEIREHRDLWTRNAQTREVEAF
jgi:hypothetical protein